jgi:hypothetical protein
MSVWRQKAIETAPELKKDFEDPDVSIYNVFSELLYVLEKAHDERDVVTIKKVYEYAEWCHRQKDQNLWNAAGVSFYEHLCDNELVFSQFTTWIKKYIYFDIRDLLNQRFGDDKMKELDTFYGWTKPRKNR